VLIALAGLPGTGKSTIAAELSRRLDAVVLNKDLIREALFPKEAIDFSRDQDDLCMKVLFLIAGHILGSGARHTIIIDGRTFSRSFQIQDLLSRAAALHAKPIIIECVCDDTVARERIERDRRQSTHPAANRTVRLYRELREKAEPITVEHLVIDTGKEPLEKCVERCMEYLEEEQNRAVSDRASLAD
jgi:predicted kinase